MIPQATRLHWDFCMRFFMTDPLTESAHLPADYYPVFSNSNSITMTMFPIFRFYDLLMIPSSYFKNKLTFSRSYIFKLNNEWKIPFREFPCIWGIYTVMTQKLSTPWALTCFLSSKLIYPTAYWHIILYINTNYNSCISRNFEVIMYKTKLLLLH